MDWLVLQQKEQLSKVMGTNEITKRYGLALSEQEAQLILEEQKGALKKYQRAELGTGITSKIIYEFCDSSYIDQNSYVDTIIRLQEIFYQYKNEMLDEITDDELLHLMKKQFELICYGDLDYLEGTCLDHFAQAVRAGYGGYRSSDGRGEYGKFEEVKRWDYDLYMEVLKELCWR